MSCRIPNVGHVFLALAATCLVTMQFSEAYEVPLTPADIHEAYVLGQRNDQVTANFLHPYISACSTPEESCFITQIELLTPFAQVVDVSRRNATKGYTEQQAATTIAKAETKSSSKSRWCCGLRTPELRRTMSRKPLRLRRVRVPRCALKTFGRISASVSNRADA